MEHEAAAARQTAVPAKPAPKKPRSNDKELEKLVRRLEREIEKQEQEIAGLDDAIAQAASDYQQLTKLLAQKEQQEQALQGLMEQWEQAAGQL